MESLRVWVVEAYWILTRRLNLAGKVQGPEVLVYIIDRYYGKYNREYNEPGGSLSCLIGIIVEGMERRKRNNLMKKMTSQIQRAEVLSRINLHISIPY